MVHRPCVSAEKSSCFYIGTITARELSVVFPLLHSRLQQLVMSCRRFSLDSQRAINVRLALFLDLLGEIVFKPHLFDRFHLRFDPIDMLIHIFGHILKHVPRGEIGHLRTMHHAIV